MSAESYSFETDEASSAEDQRLFRQAKVLFQLDWLAFCPPGSVPPSSVLDVGCGNGAYLSLIQRELPNTRLFGLEVDERRLEAARIGVPSATLLLGDACTAEVLEHAIKVASPDLVILRYVLQHLRTAERGLVLSLLARHRQHGRRFVFLEPDDSQVALSPASPAFEQAIRECIDWQRRLGGERCLGRNLGRLVGTAGFHVASEQTVEVSRLTVGWDSIRDVFWPVARRGLSMLGTEAREGICSDVESWLDAGESDEGYDYRKHLHIVVAR